MESVSDSPTARKVSDFANGQVNNFLDSVEDLTKALKDIESPDIARVRAKVKIALAAAKSAVAIRHRRSAARHDRSASAPTDTCATIPGRSSELRRSSVSRSAFWRRGAPERTPRGSQHSRRRVGCALRRAAIAWRRRPCPRAEFRRRSVARECGRIRRNSSRRAPLAARRAALRCRHRTSSCRPTLRFK